MPLREKWQQTSSVRGYLTLRTLSWEWACGLPLPAPESVHPKSEVLTLLTNAAEDSSWLAGWAGEPEVGGMAFYEDPPPRVFGLGNPQKQGERHIPGKAFSLVVRDVPGLG